MNADYSSPDVVRVVIACSSLANWCIQSFAKNVHQKPQLEGRMMPNHPLERRNGLMKDRLQHLKRFGDPLWTIWLIDYCKPCKNLLHWKKQTPIFFFVKFFWIRLVKIKIYIYIYILNYFNNSSMTEFPSHLYGCLAYLQFGLFNFQ